MDEKTCKVVVRFPRDATFLTAIFSNFPPFISLLSFSLSLPLYLPPPEATFLCTSTNFRRYITSYEYPMDIFGYAKLYKKSNVPLATKLTRGESIFFEEAYDFSFFPITTVFETRSVTPPLPLVDYSHLVIIAKSAETQKRNTNAAGRV